MRIAIDKTYFPMFSSKSFIILPYTFKSINNPEVVFGNSINKDQDSFFFYMEIWHL